METKNLPRNPDYPNLLTGGVKGHDGSNAGSPPNKLREDWRKKAAEIGNVLIPAMQDLANAISDAISGDADVASKAQEKLRTFRAAGWTPDQLIKSWGKITDVAMPKQSEIVLESNDVLNVAIEVAGSVYGPGKVEEYSKALIARLGIEPR